MDRPIEEEWRNFELYEKVRIRENRKRFFFILAATLFFFSLCAVPVVRDRMPKWQTLEAAQQLSVQIEKLKSLAIDEKKPVRLHFLDNGRYQIDIVTDCQSSTFVKTIREGEWPDAQGSLKILPAADAERLSLHLASDQICFDPVFGLDNVKTRRVLVIVPAKDLSENQLERASYVVLEGESAKISIN